MLVTSSDQLILYLMFVTCPMLVTSETLLESEMGVLDTGAIGDHRDKRQAINTHVQGFTEKQKQAILEKHNELRALARASNMLKMTWDAKLTALAQNHANRCKFEHSRNREEAAGFDLVGENLYATTGNFEPAAVVENWYDEIKDYDYTTTDCRHGAMCGHYTQVVWADSFAVGCGVKFCTQLLDGRDGYLVVCNYGPQGNYYREKPYLTGRPCSQCPADKPVCDQGLCTTSG